MSAPSTLPVRQDQRVAGPTSSGNIENTSEIEENGRSVSCDSSAGTATYGPVSLVRFAMKFEKLGPGFRLLASGTRTLS
jgi:hypothetical protein